MNTSKDSRRDPRAKILSLTVRYRSATVAEFIEDHSYDVSRGGMFIRTSAPFPNGTLLKFEVRIAEEQRVMTGVGRVTWRREKDTGEDSPAGMGVKFIKIEDDSVDLIDRLVKSRATDDVSSFEAGAKEQGIPLSDPPSNLRVGKEDRISSRPPPAGDMLDQSALLLKSAITLSGATAAGGTAGVGNSVGAGSTAGVTAAANSSLGGNSAVANRVSSKPPDASTEERKTLPTGQSNPQQKAVSLQDLAAVKGEPSIPPPNPAAGTGSGPRAEIVAAEVRAPQVPIDSDPPDSDAASEEDGPPSSDPAATSSPGERGEKRAKGNGKKKAKKEKKRKKKFRYASIPVPKQTLARAVSPGAEPLPLATITTTPPRKRSTQAPRAARTSNNVIWVVLGIVSIGLGLYWTSRNSQQDAARPAVAEPTVETPARAADPVKSATQPVSAPRPAPYVEELSASDVTPPKAGHTGAVIEEPAGGTVTEELDPVVAPSGRKPDTVKERVPRTVARPTAAVPVNPAPAAPAATPSAGTSTPTVTTNTVNTATPPTAVPTTAAPPAASPPASPPAASPPGSPPAASPPATPAAPKAVTPPPAATPKSASSAG